MRPPLKLLWMRDFQAERLSVYAQPILAGGMAVVGAKSGKIFALDAKTGVDAWQAGAAGPIVCTLASDGKRVFSAALSGDANAFDLKTGEPLWKIRCAQAGISASPLLLDENLVLGGRDGILYCLNAADGALLWSRALSDAGANAPIFQAPAGGGGRIYATTMDMRLHCVDAATGARLWTSEPVEGTYYKSFWPVLSGGSVVTTVIRYDDSVPYLHEHDAMTGKLITPERLRAFVQSACFHAPALDAAGNLVLVGGTESLRLGRYNFSLRSLEILPAPPDPFFELEPPLSCSANAVFATRPSSGPFAWHNMSFDFNAGKWDKTARDPDAPEGEWEISCFPGAIADGRFVQTMHHRVAAWCAGHRTGAEK